MNDALESLKHIIESTMESPCPVRKELVGEWHSFLVGIGPDHVAEILIDDEALKALLGETE